MSVPLASSLSERVSDANSMLTNVTKYVLSNVRQHTIGRIAILRQGEYKNRYGRITSVTMSHDGEVLLLVHPFKKTSLGKYTDELLNDRPGARSYWHINNLVIVPTIDEFVSSSSGIDVAAATDMWERRFSAIKHLMR